MSTTSTVLQALVQPATGPYTLTAGRFWSLVAVLPGLVGSVIGGLALARSGSGATRTRAVMALAMGLVCALIGGLVVGAAEGGPGTGYGMVGGVVALVVGLIAVTLGGVALARSRHTA